MSFARCLSFSWRRTPLCGWWSRSWYMSLCWPVCPWKVPGWTRQRFPRHLLGLSLLLGHCYCCDACLGWPTAHALGFYFSRSLHGLYQGASWWIRVSHGAHHCQRGRSSLLRPGWSACDWKLPSVIYLSSFSWRGSASRTTYLSRQRLHLVGHWRPLQVLSCSHSLCLDLQPLACSSGLHFSAGDSGTGFARLSSRSKLTQMAI